MRARPPKHINLDKLWTTHTLAKALDMDPSSVARWTDKGQLLSHRTPGGHRRIRAGDFIDFLHAYQMRIPAEFKEKR